MRVHINLIQIRTEYFVAQLFPFTGCKRNFRLKLQGRVVFKQKFIAHNQRQNYELYNPRPTTDFQTSLTFNSSKLITIEHTLSHF